MMPDEFNDDYHGENDNGYVPVSCDLHSQYELAIMRRTHLEIDWYDPGTGGRHTGKVMPLDIKVKNGEEFLQFVPQQISAVKQQPVEVRLDRVTLLEK